MVQFLWTNEQRWNGKEGKAFKQCYNLVGWSSQLLKDFAPVVTPRLFSIISYSLSAGSVPAG